MERKDFTPIPDPELTADEQAAMHLLKPFLERWLQPKVAELDNDAATEADVAVVENC